MWRSADREALRSIPAAMDDSQITVYSCGSILNLADMPDLRQVRRLEAARYVVALPRLCPPSDFIDFRPINEIRRGDVVFATIMERPWSAFRPGRNTCSKGTRSRSTA